MNDVTCECCKKRVLEHSEIELMSCLSYLTGYSKSLNRQLIESGR